LLQGFFWQDSMTRQTNAHLGPSDSKHVVTMYRRRADPHVAADTTGSVQRTEIDRFHPAISRRSDLKMVRGDMRVIHHHVCVITAPDPGWQCLKGVAADHLAVAPEFFDKG
jgi:hypothetical protein